MLCQGVCAQLNVYWSWGAFAGRCACAPQWLCECMRVVHIRVEADLQKGIDCVGGAGRRLACSLSLSLPLLLFHQAVRVCGGGRAEVGLGLGHGVWGGHSAPSPGPGFDNPPPIPFALPPHTRESLDPGTERYLCDVGGELRCTSFPAHRPFPKNLGARTVSPMRGSGAVRGPINVG